MKRSEMVTYLTKLLNTYEDCQLDETAADEILECLEHLGMLPPTRGPYEDGTLLNKWEPEDEKK